MAVLKRTYADIAHSLPAVVAKKGRVMAIYVSIIRRIGRDNVQIGSSEEDTVDEELILLKTRAKDDNPITVAAWRGVG
jgi:hypothetical protein